MLFAAASVVAVSAVAVVATQSMDAMTAFVTNTAKHAATEMGNSMGAATATRMLPGAWLVHRVLQLGLCFALGAACLRVREPAQLLAFSALWLVPLLEVTSYYYVLLVLFVPWAAQTPARMLTLLGACLLTQLPLVTAAALPERGFYVFASWIFVALAGFASWDQLRRRYIM